MFVEQFHMHLGVLRESVGVYVNACIGIVNLHRTGDAVVRTAAGAHGQVGEHVAPTGVETAHALLSHSGRDTEDHLVAVIGVIDHLVAHPFGNEHRFFRLDIERLQGFRQEERDRPFFHK